VIGQALGHYRILEKVGQGGMGVVYRAKDEHLDRDVALKLLPSGVLVDTAVRRRFRTEALALAKLNHPNIGTVHEFGSQDGVDFLVMEFVPGVTLQEKLAAGPLSEPETLRLGEQLALGLAAAHEQGVVHRDVKPSNLRLTSEGRLKIVDFGLAKRLEAGADLDATQTVTDPHVRAGTLPYMAPEQLRGQPPDTRSDIYAAGVVLYELITGQRPFPATHEAELIGAILHQSPAPPSTLNPRITPGFERVILKAMGKEPERRYQSAKELQIDLERLSALGQNRFPYLTRRGRLALAATFVVVLAVVALVAGMQVRGWRQRLLSPATSGSKSDSVAPPLITARRSLAVLGFKNLSGQPAAAWLSTALAEMLTTELAAGEKLRMIPAEDIDRMKRELSLTDAEALAKDTLARVRKNLGTDFVVLGSYVYLGAQAGGQIRLDLRLQDTLAGDTIAAVAETGSETNLFDLVSRSGAQLRNRLGLGVVPPSEATGVRAALPSNTEAARLYSEGLAKLRVFDALAARDLLEKAVAADPKNAIIRSALAGAWSTLGYDRQAREEAKRSLDLAASLNREDRLLVEGRYREIATEWDKAVEIYSALFRSFPDNVEYGLRLAAAQIWTSNKKNALATVDTLRKLPAALSDDPRIDLTEAEVADALDDYRREVQAAERAREKGVARGASVLVARALGIQGVALGLLGDPSGAMAAYDEARKLYLAAGDERGLADTLSGIAIRLKAQGELDKAKRTDEQVLSIYRRLGNQRGAALTSNGLGTISRDQGRLASAKQWYQDSRAALEKIGDRASTVIPLINIAELLRNLGDLRAAKSTYGEAAAICREFGLRQPLGVAMGGTSTLLALRGDLELAKRQGEEVLAIFRELGDKNFTAAALFNLGEILTAEGDLAEARRKHEEALALRQALGRKASLAESRLALATLVLAEGPPAEAEKLARESATQFRTQKMIDAEAGAQAMLARCLLAQGKVASARQAIRRTTVLLKGNENREVRLAISIPSARVQAASGDVAQARKLLAASIEEANTLGFAGYALEGRLALHEIELKSGDPVVGRAGLAALERDATAKGFGRIARLASEAGKATPPQ
jgi:tetratricopeptide (TPR) repeat protein